MINSFRGKHAFLSNFYRSPIEVNGIVFPTVEHAFVAAKVTLDYPAEQRRALQARIARLGSPAEAKRFGRTITLRSDWKKNCVGIMRSLLRLKFEHPALRDRLIETLGHTLVEGNDWGDTFWGFSRGTGQNILGKLLMERRELLADDMDRNKDHEHEAYVDPATRQALMLHDAVSP